MEYCEMPGMDCQIDSTPSQIKKFSFLQRYFVTKGRKFELTRPGSEKKS
jgi:hypothetical protein